MKIPFWEDSYKNDSVSTFGSLPNATLVEFRYLFDKSWSVLDVGCGEGKNSLYLASLGYNKIDAFDLSESAIAKLNRLAISNTVHVNTWVQDLTKFTFYKPYDLIIPFGTLHFVEKKDWRSFILNAKENTAINGVHIIQIFTNVLPATPDIAPFSIGLANDHEIKELYCDWEIILQFKSYTFEDEHPGIPKHFHSSNKLVAMRRQQL